MPKRRKRSTLANRPSLVFTESPVNIQNNVPSPVFCARHPPTAKSVPVDELEELPWVSPQFTHTYTADGKRVTRQRKRNKSCLQSLTNKENTWHVPRHALEQGHNKFRSLRFIGDQTSVASLDEDLHISVDSDTGTDEDNARNTNIAEDGGRRSVPRVGNHVCSDVTGEQAPSVGRRGKSRCRCDKDIDGSGTPKCSEDLNDSSTIDFTNLQKEIIQNAPVKRLFASQIPKSTPVFSDNSGAQTVAEVSESEGDILARVSESDQDTVGDGGSDGSPPVRRSLRLLVLRNSLMNGHTPRHSHPALVLVPDTPEEEYGWPIRKQQLRNHLRKS